jgi:hypothetical protein
VWVSDGATPIDSGMIEEADGLSSP